MFFLRDKLFIFYLGRLLLVFYSKNITYNSGISTRKTRINVRLLVLILDETHFFNTDNVFFSFFHHILNFSCAFPQNGFYVLNITDLLLEIFRNPTLLLTIQGLADFAFAQKLL